MQLADKGLSLAGPSAPRWWCWAAAANHCRKGQYEEALEYFRRSYVEQNWLDHLALAYTLPYVGKIEEARAEILILMRLNRASVSRKRIPISTLDDTELRPDQAKTISESLKVSESEVVYMDRRLRGDVSLNSRNSDAFDGDEAIERLVIPRLVMTQQLADDEELLQRHEALQAALQTLSPREDTSSPRAS